MGRESIASFLNVQMRKKSVLFYVESWEKVLITSILLSQLINQKDSLIIGFLF